MPSLIEGIEPLDKLDALQCDPPGLDADATFKNRMRVRGNISLLARAACDFCFGRVGQFHNAAFVRVHFNLHIGQNQVRKFERDLFVRL